MNAWWQARLRQRTWHHNHVLAETHKVASILLLQCNSPHIRTRPCVHSPCFVQAMEHVTRIARIIDLPRGNAMLVGVGGSGKQSLARLASYICGYDVFQISVSSTYGLADFKANLLSLYQKVSQFEHSRDGLIVMGHHQLMDERSSGIQRAMVSHCEWRV